MISNAVKSSKEKGQVEFRTSASIIESQSEATIRFEIIDHGSGISPREIERIFEPYVQADNALTSRRQGTGLGLAISSQLSDLMGGQLVCKSELGSGSRFILEVPLEIADAVHPLRTFPGLAPEEKQLSDFSQSELEVLVVDDHQINLKIAVHILKKMGIHADTANNGQEALSACLSKHYHLVFMDLQMPVMDGQKATASILAQVPEETRPRIVALTANISSTQRDACLKIGMDDYLTKPVKKAHMAEVISRTIAKKSESSQILVASA